MEVLYLISMLNHGYLHANHGESATDAYGTCSLGFGEDHKQLETEFVKISAIYIFVDWIESIDGRVIGFNIGYCW